MPLPVRFQVDGFPWVPHQSIGDKYHVSPPRAQSRFEIHVFHGGKGKALIESSHLVEEGFFNAKIAGPQQSALLIERRVLQGMNPVSLWAGLPLEHLGGRPTVSGGDQGTKPTLIRKTIVIRK